MRIVAGVLALMLAAPAWAVEYEAVSKACGKAALSKGLLVAGVTGFRDVTGAAGQVVSVQATLTFRATRRRLVCTYDVATRRTTLEEIGREQRAPTAAVTWQACEAAAERQGYRPSARIEQADLEDRFGSVSARLTRLRANKDRVRWIVECTYDFATERVRVEASRQ